MLSEIVDRFLQLPSILPWASNFSEGGLYYVTSMACEVGLVVKILSKREPLTAVYFQPPIHSIRRAEYVTWEEIVRIGCTWIVAGDGS